ncbi:unnamed protein product [Pleuronectes platessa]|uniref:Uncharacterized protein n=1 Tax=Pleuronectes platessa TaxID=8262 RepID=A0A9N7TFY2_PLEPL|nr:unnamed protein product [Pleuronectes platessa]
MAAIQHGLSELSFTFAVIQRQRSDERLGAYLWILTGQIGAVESSESSGEEKGPPQSTTQLSLTASESNTLEINRVNRLLSSAAAVASGRNGGFYTRRPGGGRNCGGSRSDICGENVQDLQSSEPWMDNYANVKDAWKDRIDEGPHGFQLWIKQLTPSPSSHAEMRTPERGTKFTPWANKDQEFEKWEKEEKEEMEEKSELMGGKSRLQTTTSCLGALRVSVSIGQCVHHWSDLWRATVPQLWLYLCRGKATHKSIVYIQTAHRQEKQRLWMESRPKAEGNLRKEETDTGRGPDRAARAVNIGLQEETEEVDG